MSVDTTGSTELDWSGHDSIAKSPPSLRQLVFQEARSVAAWFAVSTFFRALVEFLIELASYRTVRAEYQCVSKVPKNVLMTLSICTTWLFRALPYKLAQGAAPGFIYASPWILMTTRNVFGSFPNVPLRIAEGVLGRLSLQQLAVLVVLHFACAVSTSFMLRYLTLAEAYPLAFSLIEYSDGSPWPLDMIRETIATSTFCVAILVIPELFAVNKIPKWCCVPLMYPIYNLSVDANGKGSTFGPNTLYALEAISSSESKSFLGQSMARMIGSLLGGLIGGVIVHRFFPDDEHQTYSPKTDANKGQ